MLALWLAGVAVALHPVANGIADRRGVGIDEASMRIALALLSLVAAMYAWEIADQKQTIRLLTDSAAAARMRADLAAVRAKLGAAGRNTAGARRSGV